VDAWIRGFRILSIKHGAWPSFVKHSRQEIGRSNQSLLRNFCGNYPLNGNGYWNYFIAKLGFVPFSLGIEWRVPLPWLSVSGDISNRFALEYVPALGASNSCPSFATNTIPTNPVVLPDISAVGNARRFHRAKLRPSASAICCA